MLQFLGNYCWLRLALNLLPMTFQVLSNLVLCRVFSYCLIVCIIGALGMQNFNTCLDVVAPATSLLDRNMCPRDSKDKAGAAGTSLVGSPPAVLAIHNAGIGLLHEGMREIAVVPWFSFSPDIFRPKLTCAVSFYVRSLFVVLPSIRFI